MTTIKVKKTDYPECSGNPASCPENEGYGCCMPNPQQRKATAGVTNPLEQIRELAPYLRNYEQCDEDGVMCSVSRQAIETLLSILDTNQGYVCVPIEPTGAMIEAGCKAIACAPDLGGIVAKYTPEGYECWAAMLAASKETNHE